LGCPRSSSGQLPLIRYGIPHFIHSNIPCRSKNVHVDKQPTDCEWSDAPIGDKNCHYKKNVYEETNAHGRVTDVWITWEKVEN
jgi:hypothetical protein